MNSVSVARQPAGALSCPFHSPPEWHKETGMARGELFMYTVQGNPSRLRRLLQVITGLWMRALGYFYVGLSLETYKGLTHTQKWRQKKNRERDFLRGQTTLWTLGYICIQWNFNSALYNSLEHQNSLVSIRTWEWKALYKQLATTFHQNVW